MSGKSKQTAATETGLSDSSLKYSYTNIRLDNDFEIRSKYYLLHFSCFYSNLSRFFFVVALFPLLSFFLSFFLCFEGAWIQLTEFHVHQLFTNYEVSIRQLVKVSFLVMVIRGCRITTT